MRPALVSEVGLALGKLFTREYPRLRQNPKMIQQTLRQTRLAERLAQAIQESVFQRPKRSQQIAAVHRRNNPRRQGRERARVIPVQQMATMLCETSRRSQCLLCQDRQLGNCQISELNRNLPCVEQKTEIGRGYPRRDRRRLLLDVVRDEPVVFRCTELGEISPGVKSGTSKKQGVSSRKVVSWHSWRTIQPTGYKFAAGPEHKNRHRSNQ